MVQGKTTITSFAKGKHTWIAEIYSIPRMCAHTRTHVAEARQAAVSLTHVRLDVSSITETYPTGVADGQLTSRWPTKYSLGSIRNSLHIEGFSPFVQSWALTLSPLNLSNGPISLPQEQYTGAWQQCSLENSKSFTKSTSSVFITEAADVEGEKGTHLSRMMLGGGAVNLLLWPTDCWLTGLQGSAQGCHQPQVLLWDSFVPRGFAFRATKSFQ